MKFLRAFYLYYAVEQFGLPNISLPRYFVMPFALILGLKLFSCYCCWLVLVETVPRLLNLVLMILIRQLAVAKLLDFYLELLVVYYPNQSCLCLNRFVMLKCSPNGLTLVFRFVHPVWTSKHSGKPLKNSL